MEARLLNVNYVKIEYEIMSEKRLDRKKSFRKNRLVYIWKNEVFTGK